ncbi:MAG TPA: 2-oxo-4-hydroxy-4-carboxy-5-ureidoimidazoline decarboxylase [Chitinophagaceae bacterium]|nr:2-oxo-4-hydroxy-4-carboxy-5-ureidoimidazoline decarboxylase [Chitinophagaceae bacterium]HNC38527.1 2-oxo-4-hydroxy-4-carboxy-5-ureidoimidazoline decarboxylase [Chitinophagaceae bacterium]HND95338.1 2-oxo-4-hydroxy-4-carboxy-5-ureidoimidazoline decarboxylase [Chitinophagaceae bacterium]HNK60270.1 2-oxo-4-hydroxy-4-carboxy-5-ureidoimidazoline decarboxylase [Chitinophagaceae bacterium]HNO54499.1 2-oxo-4-hydroxy-4-carboxy-5-ureidoimidazoline decarboxylase [Chitinophagaceae bacterium]
MTLHEFNTLPHESLIAELSKCCGARAWVQRMLPFIPADDLVELLEDAESQWWLCNEEDWKEAFTHHPKIGDLDSLKKKFANTAVWASGEQSGVNTATDVILNALAEGNRLYEEKFGYIFIVCASGKSAEEMLGMLNERLKNNPEDEIRIAADEQNKITLLRLEKLLQ